MQPTALLVGIMDSQREKLPVTLPVQELSLGGRLGRAALRVLIVSGVGALLIPVPLMHLCGAVVAAVVGPIVGVFAFMPKAKIGAGEVHCPKCAKAVPVPEGLLGWPARLQCPECKSRVELTRAEAAP